MGAYLTSEQILAATDLPAEDVEVPEWADPASGATMVMVRGLTGEERDEWEASLWVTRGNQFVKDTANIRAKLAARCIVDPDTREPMFTQQHVYALGKLSGAALDRVWNVATRLSGIGPSAEADLEGKSPPPDGSGSPTS